MIDWEWESLFGEVQADEEQGGQLSFFSAQSSLRVGQMGYITKTITSGPTKEIMVFPAWGRQETQEARKRREQLSDEHKQKQNRENMRRRLCRLLDANFDRQDQHVTLTYMGTPPDREQVRKDARNFIARVKRRREQLGLDQLRYIYVIEDECSGKKRRVHIHAVVSGGMSRDELERIWEKGWANCKRLQPDPKDGLRGLGRYLTKQERERYERAWSCSKNLKKPEVTYSRTKLTARKVKSMCFDAQAMAAGILEKLYPRHAFARMVVKATEGMEGVFLYAVMRERVPAGARGNGREGRGHGENEQADSKVLDGASAGKAAKTVRKKRGSGKRSAGSCGGQGRAEMGGHADAGAGRDQHGGGRERAQGKGA